MLGALSVLWCYVVLSGKQLYTVRLESTSVLLSEPQISQCRLVTKYTGQKVQWKDSEILVCTCNTPKLTFRVGYISSSCCSIIFGTPLARVCRICSSLKTCSSHVLNCGLCNIRSDKSFLLKKSSLAEEVCQQLHPPLRLCRFIKIQKGGVPLRPILRNIKSPYLPAAHASGS